MVSNVFLSFTESSKVENKSSFISLSSNMMIIWIKTKNEHWWIFGLSEKNLYHCIPTTILELVTATRSSLCWLLSLNYLSDLLNKVELILSYFHSWCVLVIQIEHTYILIPFSEAKVMYSPIHLLIKKFYSPIIWMTL